MSDEGGSTRGWGKRVEARVALALTRAQAAFKLASAMVAQSGNHAAIFNGADIGPAARLKFASDPFTSQTGHVRVSVFATITGGTLAAGDSAELGIQRDAAIAIGTGSGVTLGTGAASRFALSYSFDDEVASGDAHTWNLDVICSNGHTASLLTGDATIEVMELGS